MRVASTVIKARILLNIYGQRVFWKCFAGTERYRSCSPETKIGRLSLGHISRFESVGLVALTRAVIAVSASKFAIVARFIRFIVASERNELYYVSQNMSSIGEDNTVLVQNKFMK